MTSSKIADGVIRDTSYLAYLTITFHTSPIHNIFIVRIADPITRGYEIIGRYENDRDEIPFRRTPNIEYLPVPASFLIFSTITNLREESAASSKRELPFPLDSLYRKD